MARTTDECIRAIADVDPNVTLGPFIEAASIMVTRMTTCATEKGLSHTADQLRMIEQYLAAHFYHLRDPRYRSKSTERASASFELSKPGEGLKSTDYGRTAMMFDDTGCLADLSGGIRAELVWLGKPPSEQTDYVDRD